MNERRHDNDGASDQSDARAQADSTNANAISSKTYKGNTNHDRDFYPHQKTSYVESERGGAFSPPATKDISPIVSPRKRAINMNAGPSTGINSGTSRSSSEGEIDNILGQDANNANHDDSSSSNYVDNNLGNENQNNNEQPQNPIATSTPTHEENTTRNDEDTYLLQQFWRTYDTIIILSIFAVLGIIFRMMSATWFRMELGVVFSEDSALGTNLPLNVWSCFLMGLLCSGK